jgi:hypothetical protein
MLAVAVANLAALLGLLGPFLLLLASLFFGQGAHQVQVPQCHTHCHSPSPSGAMSTSLHISINRGLEGGGGG